MKLWRQGLMLAGLVLALALINWQIYAKEQTLAKGWIVLMKLRPADPRSLIQGDYMRLAYDRRIYPRSAVMNKLPVRGRVVLKLTADRVGSFSRVDGGEPLAANEVLIQYKKPGGGRWWRGMRYSATSYFFQEGFAKQYQQAKYAILRIDASGKSVLAGLADNQHRPIRPRR